MLGGLMTQTAAMAGIPIVEMDAGTGTCSEDILPLLNGYEITCKTREEYYDKIGLLIRDEDEKERVSSILRCSLISMTDFDRNLAAILEKKESSYMFKDMFFSEKQAAEDYLESENNALHDVPRVLANRYMLRFYPVSFLLNFIRSRYYKMRNNVLSDT